MLPETTPDVRGLPILKPTVQMIINTKTGATRVDERAQQPLCIILEEELPIIRQGRQQEALKKRNMPHQKKYNMVARGDRPLNGWQKQARLGKLVQL